MAPPVRPPPTAATIFDKGYSGIVKELKPLLKWSEVPANAVENIRLILVKLIKTLLI
ncbi:hypothetical protein ABUR93_15410 [Staphylococcus aureus]|nr:hypothetical protein [Staphylococcus aureus]MCE3416031.1 hypothetical protein [Staphylococcus aureus]